MPVHDRFSTDLSVDDCDKTRSVTGAGLRSKIPADFCRVTDYSFPAKVTALIKNDCTVSVVIVAANVVSGYPAA